MLINEITNRPDFHLHVIAELREVHGIKYRRDKKHKSGQDKKHGKLFGTPLEKLELTDVILVNGGIVQVPIFVSDACQRILEQVKTEGLFRKAGSTNRQREIRANLDAGLRLGKTHHVIDVANILKLFFRELPEPLLPPGNIQESILRSLLCGDRKIEALMTTCLLLPLLSLNTLSFFMQFLNTVSRHSNVNKMTIENLAIIFAPGLMPIVELINQRLTNHVRIIQMLIENAFEIGVVPPSILSRTAQMLAVPETDKKKKKRRSGSLTRMFNGLRKIVLGSSESLDKNIERVSSEEQLVTPCINKSTRKRRVLEVNAFSVKKKKDVISSMPDNGGILPSTPSVIKENKKSRLSLGGKRTGKANNFTSTLIIPPMERRWSVVGAGWSKKKSQPQSTEYMQPPLRPLSPVISLPCLQASPSHLSGDKENVFNTLNTETTKNVSYDFVRIPKSEYEAIKERVSAIETRISEEFNHVHAAIVCADNGMNGPEKVLSKYEQTLENTEELANTSTDQLAKRLSRELKIRRSDEHKVIRSPSARKIGSMRRRSRESVRLSRNLSWHLGNQSHSIDLNETFLDVSNYPKKSLKRGRPNTVQSGLRQPSPNKKLHNDHEAKVDQHYDAKLETERWVNAEKFFEDFPKPFKASPQSKQNSMNSVKEPSTPYFISTATLAEMKTPMLPPRLPFKKTPATVQKTPMLPPSASSDRMPISATVNKTLMTPLQEQQTGRASIARLRCQNAGMVAAKAKLFGGMVAEQMPTTNGPRESSRFIVSKQSKDSIGKGQINHLFKDKQKQRLNINSPRKLTPRRTNHAKNTNGIHRRQQLRLGKSPAQKSPLKSIVLKDNQSINNYLTNDMQKVIAETCSPSDQLLLKQNKLHSSVDTTPHIKRALVVKSPRRLLKTPTRERSRRSPMRATPAKQRSSPRLQLHNY